MRLIDFFNKSIGSAINLQKLYDGLEFSEKKTRSEWRDKLFGNSLVGWGKREGVWRSISSDERIQIVGSNSKRDFQSELALYRPMLLQQSLVMMLAAIDKLLHQATITRNFVQILRTGKLDDMTRNFPISETYNIAMEARVRRGYGGRIRPRPANKIREAVSEKLYEISFLSANSLEKICSINGAKGIFTTYARYLGKSPESLKRQWSLIYRKRNAIVHECNVVRTKIAPKQIRFDIIDPVELRKDIKFAEDFGKFIASKLS